MKIKRVLAVLLVCVLISADVMAIAEEVLNILQLPSALKVIEEEAFYGDTSLEKVIVPEGAEKIEGKAFADSSIAEIELPESLEEISDNAFEGVEGLKVSAPEDSYAYGWAVDNGYIGNVEATPVEYFEYVLEDGECTITGYIGKDEYVIIPSEIEGCPVINIGESAFDADFLEDIILKEVRIPDSVDNIDNCAFYGCSELTEIVLPKNLTRIGDMAFQDCVNLESIVFSENVSFIGFQAFASCDSLENIYCKIGSVSATTITENDDWWQGDFIDIDYPAYKLRQYDDGSITLGISSYMSNETSIVLPSEFAGYPVVEIGWCAFDGNNALESITLPDNLLRIDNYVFRSCDSLTNITFPESLTTIGDGAFARCGLTNVFIPPNVSTIGEGVFTECENLQEIEVSGKNQHYMIKDGILYTKDLEHLMYCPIKNQIGDYVVPDGVKHIDNWAFEYCEGITNITIPSSTITIGDYSFHESKVSGFFMEYGLKTIGRSAFSSCPNLTSADIPDSVTQIGDYAFAFSENLQHCKMSNSIKAIPENLFYTCKMDSFAVPDGVTRIASGAFDTYSCMSVITIPSSVTYIASDAFYSWAEGMTIYGEAESYAQSYAETYAIPFVPCEIPNPLWNMKYSLDDNGCVIEQYYGNDETIVIPDTIVDQPVYRIEEYAFGWPYDNFKHIELPDTVKSIGARAFAGSPHLENINIPNAIEIIEENAFYNCSNLKSISLPNKPVEIERYAFSDCDRLKSITIPEKIKSIGQYAFYSCDNLESVIIEDGFTTIDFSLFANCTKLKTIEIPESVTTIKWSAFDNCNDDLTIYGEAGSFVATYAEENEIAFVDGTMPTGSAILSGKIVSQNSDTGIPGIIVTVYDVDNQTIVGTIISDSNGMWQKSGLLRGQNYRVNYHSSNYVLSSEETTIMANQAIQVLPDVTAILKEDVDGTAELAVNCAVTEVETGVPVEFDISVSNANQVRLIADGVIYETYDCDEAGGKIERAFTKAGDRIIQFQAGMNNVWGSVCDPIAIKVTNEKGELESAQVNIDKYCPAFEDAYVSWDAVANAEQYTVYVYVNGVSVYRSTLQDTAITIPSSALRYPGNYAVEVIATAVGYTQSSGSASV